MRLQRNAFHLSQHFGHAWLVGKHIEASAGNTASMQGFDQIGLIDQLAARDIDQKTVLAERVQHRRVDDAARLVCCGSKDQHIAVARELQQIGDERVGHIVHGVSDRCN